MQEGLSWLAVKPSTILTPLYVLCHGLKRSMDFDFLPELSAKLPYNTFRFDFTGNGLSQAEFSFGEYSRDVEDLRDAVTYLRSQGFTVKGS
jgi:pimeloyl-ACP methyl ester carboxylesterase